MLREGYSELLRERMYVLKIEVQTFLKYIILSHPRTAYTSLTDIYSLRIRLYSHQSSDKNINSQGIHIKMGINPFLRDFF